MIKAVSRSTSLPALTFSRTQGHNGVLTGEIPQYTRGEQRTKGQNEGLVR